ncbi:SapB/AmfS family lanthipeptide [Kitasatospora sp. MMS16-BH015]|nr:SapB/AmfS family lanthipeptide [Kitasatospora sp. MMS16-BH015]
MEILELQSLETPVEDTTANASTLSVVNCGVSTVSTILCL